MVGRHERFSPSRISEVSISLLFFTMGAGLILQDHGRHVAFTLAVMVPTLLFITIGLLIRDMHVYRAAHPKMIRALDADATFMDSPWWWTIGIALLAGLPLTKTGSQLEVILTLPIAMKLTHAAFNAASRVIRRRRFAPPARGEEGLKSRLGDYLLWAPWMLSSVWILFVLSAMADSLRSGHISNQWPWPLSALSMLGP